MQLVIPQARAAAQTSLDQPVYVRAHSGWLGLFGGRHEYARFSVPGADAQLQDATHILLQPGLGMMVSFVEKAELSGGDLLRAHAQWEADYWRSHATQVDTATRADLTGNRSDVRATALTVRNAGGETMSMYLVAQRAADGVFVYAFSPATPAADALVARFVKSLAIIHQPLTAAEVKRVSIALRR